MTVTATGQIWIFLGTVLCGVLLGVLFDIFRVLRRVRRPSVLEANIQDFVFWITAAAIVFTFIFVINNGELRFFEFLGVFAAGLLYNLTISPYMVKLGVFICNLIKNSIRFVVKTVFAPFIWILKMFRKPFFLVINTGKAKMRWIKHAKRAIKNNINKSFKNFYKIFKKV